MQRCLRAASWASGPSTHAANLSVIPLLPGSSHSSSRLKHDTRQSCDRSRDGSIDPEEGKEEGKEGRREGAADVAEKRRQVIRKQPDSYRKLGSSASEQSSNIVALMEPFVLRHK